jgi:hypothetical protein
MEIINHIERIRCSKAYKGNKKYINDMEFIKISSEIEKWKIRGRIEELLKIKDLSFYITELEPNTDSDED